MSEPKYTLVIEQGKTGSFYGTCPERRGLLIVEKTEQAVRDAFPIALAEMDAAEKETSKC